jgi:hypothetical protein
MALGLASKLDAKLLVEIRHVFYVLFENIEINCAGWRIGFVDVQG